mmetsp:Transcript_1231/g.3575  ORF Transcript_1231/g.3575 Transcript_1231/m.3575 type:complete len:216 (-) Transcript_1231:403-1050(-)
MTLSPTRRSWPISWRRCGGDGRLLPPRLSRGSKAPKGTTKPHGQPGTRSSSARRGSAKAAALPRHWTAPSTSRSRPSCCVRNGPRLPRTPNSLLRTQVVVSPGIMLRGLPQLRRWIDCPVGSRPVCAASDLLCFCINSSQAAPRAHSTVLKKSTRMSAATSSKPCNSTPCLRRCKSRFRGACMPSRRSALSLCQGPQGPQELRISRGLPLRRHAK